MAKWKSSKMAKLWRGQSSPFGDKTGLALDAALVILINSYFSLSFSRFLYSHSYKSWLRHSWARFLRLYICSFVILIKSYFCSISPSISIYASSLSWASTLGFENVPLNSTFSYCAKPEFSTQYIVCNHRFNQIYL